MSSLPRMKPIVPWWQLALLLVVCAAGVYYLLPDDPAHLENLVRDGKAREARRLLERIPAAERARDPLRFHLLEVRLGRLELPAPDENPAPRAAALDALAQRAATSWRDSRFAAVLHQELLETLALITRADSPWRILAPILRHAPEDQRLPLVSRLTQVALAQGDPALAAEIFAAGSETSSRSETDALELARLWQMAGRPEEALAALGEHRSANVVPRRIALLRSLNRNREALDLLRAHPGLAEPAASRNQVVEIALAAGAPGEAVPALRERLAANPDDLDTLRSLRAVLVGAGQPAEAIASARRAVELAGRKTDDLLELARILEWSGRPRDAFDVWAELADADHPGALERLMALNPGLFRDADLASTLRRALERRPRDDLQLALARLEIELGNYDSARTTLESYLSRHPEPAVMLELVQVLRENFEFPAAEKWLRLALASKPSDIRLRRELADLLIYQRRHADALAIFADLLPQSDAEEIIGPFIRLSESLGRFDDFGRGLQRRVAASSAPSERDFILLAYAFELAAEPADRRAAIEEGLRRHPGSNDLRLQLAYLLSAEQNHRGALQVLERHTRLREEVAPLSLYLDLLRLTNDLAGERRFFAAPLAPDVADEEPIVERIARAHEGARNFPEAERLWRELLRRNPGSATRVAELARVLLLQRRTTEARQLLAPLLADPTPPVLRLAAEISEASGDHRAGEMYRTAYLAAVRNAPAVDWGALGDVRLTRGDRAGARRAYAEALRRMHAELAAKGALR